MDMDEDMSHLTADDSRLSDTNSLMVHIKYNYFLQIYIFIITLTQHLGRKTFNFWNTKTCY